VLKVNPGFYCIGVFTLTAIGAVLVTSLIFGNIISNSFTTVFMNDCFTMASSTPAITNIRIMIFNNLAPAVGANPTNNEAEKVDVDVNVQDGGQNEVIVLNENHNSVMVKKSFHNIKPTQNGENYISEIDLSKGYYSKVYTLERKESDEKQVNNYNNIVKENTIKPHDLQSERDSIRHDIDRGVDAAETQGDFTNRDYQLMTVDESLLYDKRTFLEYYFKVLIRTHLIIRAFYYKSIIVPQFIRIIAFFLSVSLYFALNAIFYTDDFIVARSQYKSSVSPFI
jgi:hypothetical protein